MAQQDKTQKFGFVYVDIQKLLKQNTQSEKSPEKVLEGAPTVNFNKDPLPPAPPEPELNQDAKQRTVAIQQIRQNLDRLQSLHHKLHAILADLNKLSDSKKKTP